MSNTLRKVALQIAIPVVALLISVNAYVVSTNLKRIQQAADHRLQAAVMQSSLSNFLVDLDEMETSQRGYLLTGDPSYLQPYSQATGRLAAHFFNLRSRLTNSPAQERLLEGQLESVAEAKIAEMEETIRLREQGYRHRAFLLVGTNRGKQLMDEARTAINALSSAQTRSITRYDGELKESGRRAYRESALANCILLVLTVITLLAFNTYSRRLELRCSQHSEQLRATCIQLERLTSTISNDLRGLVGKTRSYATMLLNFYGGFLPRQGREQAECIEDGAGEMNRILDDLFEKTPPGPCVKVIEVRRAKKLSA